MADEKVTPETLLKLGFQETHNQKGYVIDGAFLLTYDHILGCWAHNLKNGKAPIGCYNVSQLQTLYTERTGKQLIFKQ